MIPLLLSIFLSILYARLIFSSKESAVYYFIPYNYLFDLIFFSSEAGTAMASTVVRVIILVVFFARTGGKEFFTIKKPSFIFFLLIGLILLISSLFGESDTKSLMETIKFILIILSFFILLSFFSSRPVNVAYLKRMVLQLGLITIINVLVSNIFSFGWGGYGEDVGFYTGGLISNMWYIPAFTVVGYIAVTNMVKVKSNLFLTITSVIVLLILVVALRRSAYSIIIIGVLGALLFLKIKARILKIGMLLAVLVAIASPFFIPFLERQLEARTKTFDKNVDEESRFKETEALWGERFDTAPTTVLLFGEKPFDSTGNYGYGRFGDRPLHVDMNIVFFSAGLIGFILYLLIYLGILRSYYLISRKFRPRADAVRVYRYLFFSSFFSLIALSFSGGLNAITYRMFGFLLLAMAMGQLNYIYVQAKAGAEIPNTES